MLNKFFRVICKSIIILTIPPVETWHGPWLNIAAHLYRLYGNVGLFSGQKYVSSLRVAPLFIHNCFPLSGDAICMSFSTVGSMYNVSSTTCVSVICKAFLAASSARAFPKDMGSLLCICAAHLQIAHCFGN